MREGGGLYRGGCGVGFMHLSRSFVVVVIVCPSTIDTSTSVREGG